MKINWHTEKRKLSELIPASWNPRELTQEQEKQLKKSLKKFGYVETIDINLNNNIIGGHQRLKILAELGIDEIDVRVPDHLLTEEEEKELNLRLNKNTAQFVPDLLAKNFSLPMLEDIGFNKDELNITLLSNNEIIEDEAPELNKVEPVVKLDDIWELGNHRIMCGDCTVKDSIELLMNGQLADMVLTDPPYGVKYQARTGIRSGKIRENMKMIKNDDLSVDELELFLKKFLELLLLYIKNECPIYICNNWKCAALFLRVLSFYGLQITSWIVWNKDWMSVGYGDYRSNHEFIFYIKRNSDFYAKKGIENDVWTIRKLSPSKKEHTTEKPVGLSYRAIKNSSKKDMIIYDCFLGSGSTLIACEQTDRICYGMELEPRYCDVIIARWEKFTGKKAIKINGK